MRRSRYHVHVWDERSGESHTVSFNTRMAAELYISDMPRHLGYSLRHINGRQLHSRSSQQ